MMSSVETQRLHLSQRSTVQKCCCFFLQTVPQSCWLEGCRALVQDLRKAAIGGIQCRDNGGPTVSRVFVITHGKLLKMEKPEDRPGTAERNLSPGSWRCHELSPSPETKTHAVTQWRSKVREKKMVEQTGCLSDQPALSWVYCCAQISCHWGHPKSPLKLGLKTRQRCNIPFWLGRMWVGDLVNFLVGQKERCQRSLHCYCKETSTHRNFNRWLQNYTQFRDIGLARENM